MVRRPFDAQVVGIVNDLLEPIDSVGGSADVFDQCCPVRVLTEVELFV
ncbi:Uncharacterised protein [Mycobacteroides abscessus subsp. abscessus]|nr:Uncharacterised protein [Mycobacteroides abscessus subsp. abscessus]